MSAERNVEEERQNAENVIRGHKAFNEGDFEGVLRFISTEYELHPAVGGAFTGETVYRGHDGFRRYIQTSRTFLRSSDSSHGPSGRAVSGLWSTSRSPVTVMQAVSRSLPT